VKGGGAFDDYGVDVAVDAAGNGYVTGRFQGTATFGPTTLTSSGSFDVFVAKLASNGNFEWAVKGGGSTFDAGSSVAVDADGNSYVTGYFEETAAFGSITLTSAGDQDVFVAKLASNGSFEWAVKGGGSTFDAGSGVAVDAAGNVYVTGRFDGAATFGSTILTSSGLRDVFVAKLASNGSFAWAVKAGSSSDDTSNDVVVDTAGNSYVTGVFQGTATFGSTTLTSSGWFDAFAAKLASNGIFEWAVKGGGSSLDGGTGVAVDAAGNSYLTGAFQGTATFGSNTLTSSGDRDVFVAQLSAATVVPEDVNEDGVVDFGDVLVILAEWGLCDGCREDIDGSGAVDFTDLLVVLSAWG